MRGRVSTTASKTTPELLPIVDRSLVKSSEAEIEPQIMAYSFQTETTIQTGTIKPDGDTWTPGASSGR